MPVDITTNVTVGNATKQDDYVRLRDSIKEAAGAFAGVSIPLGGSLKDFVLATSEVDLDDGWEREVDGTHLAACEVILEVNVLQAPNGSGPDVTVTVDLFNVTTAAQVGSSAVATLLTDTVRKHGKSVALTLASGINRYKARAKVSNANRPCSVVAWLVIRGS